MTLFLLFAGLGVLIYLSAALAAAASGNRVHVDLGLHFAVFASVLIALVGTMLFYASRLVGASVFVTSLIFVGTVTIVIARNRDAGQVVRDATTRTQPPAAAPRSEQTRAGEALFNELGCIG